MANRILLLAVILSLTPLLAIPQPTQIPPPPEYAIEDLGVLPGDTDGYAWGLDEAGNAVGGSSGPNGVRAFRFTDEGGIEALSCLANRPYCIARDVNQAGEAAGSAWSSPVDQPGHAVRWTAGIPEDLGTLETGAQSEAWAINATGVVVGYSYTGGGAGPHAFTYRAPEGMTDLTPESTGYAYDINDRGQRAGYRREAEGFRAFRWSEGVEESFGVLPGLAHSFGTAINGRGQVAGHSRNSDGTIERIMRYTDGVGLRSLGGVNDHNRAWGINRFGDVVGEGRPGSGPVRAVLYTDEDGFRDLTLLLDPRLGWFLMAATDINDAGQIVGYGVNQVVPGVRAVRLTPVSIPDIPPDLRLQGVWPDAVRLTWSAVPGADLYRVYESTDKFRPAPWRVLAETTATSHEALGHLHDGLDHFYVVRAVHAGTEAGSSAMAAKVPLAFSFSQDRTRIAWFSLPYNASYLQASDLASTLGPSRIDVVGRWDAARQSSTVFYHTGGAYRGEDFAIAPGDGLYLGLRESFTFVVLGTDDEVSLSFTLNPAPTGNVNWVGLPYTSAYRRASDLTDELGPDRVVEVGTWDATAQTSARWSWTGSTWAGTDFAIRPGDGVYVVVATSFTWEPRLIGSGAI